MKPKNLILSLTGLIFGLFLFLLPNFVEAACQIYCTYCDSSGDCAWYGSDGVGWERLGIVGNVEKAPTKWGTWCPKGGGDGIDPSCSDSNGKCQESAFPTGYNGQSCTGKDGKWHALGCNLTECDKTGVWDASDPDSGDGPACVICNGKVESLIIGNTSQVNNVCGTLPAGDGQCESACGASSECDEKDYGLNVPVSGGKCDNCVFTPTPAGCTSSPSQNLVAGDNTIDFQTPHNYPDNLDCYSNTYTCPSGYYAKAYVKYITESGYDYFYIYNASDNTYDMWSGDSGGFVWREHPDTRQVKFRFKSDGSVTYWGVDVDKINCYTTALPDLQITDIWFGSDRKVNYSIYNYGTATAVASKSALNVDGSYTTYDDVAALDANTGRDEYFSGWTCTAGQTYSIQVCADKDSVVTESNEGNNCRTESLTCPALCGNGTIDSGESCEPPNSTNNTYCSQTTSKCDTTNRKYCTRDSYGNCNSSCQCVEDSWNCGSADDSNYCSYCTHCGDGVCNCGETSSSCSSDCPTGFDFSISINPTSGSVTQGSSISATVNTTLTSGSTQSVSFSASGLPSGASASFNPSSCNPSCSSTMTINTSATTPTGTYSINVCGTGGGRTHCVTYGLTVTAAGVAINPPSVTTNAANPVTSTSATLNGTLNSLGYDPAICPSCSCIVWFKWGPTTAMANSTPVQTKTSTSSFSANISGLTSGQTYYFEAFAKNGGSW